MMELWHFNIDRFPEVKMEQAYSQLPENICDDIKRYRFLDDRKCRLVARLLIQKFVRDQSGSFDWSAWGETTKRKPFLENGPFFNISHAGKMVVVAFSNTGEIGVDIEKITELEIESISSYFHLDEIAYLKENNFSKDLFYRIWSRKEAFLKTIGIGILEGLNQVSVLENVKYQGKDVYLKDIRIFEGYSCSIGTYMEKITPDIREITYNTLHN